jgi:superfamily II DNA or RNA helicase
MSKLLYVKDVKKSNKTTKIIKDCNVKENQKFGFNPIYAKRKEVETFELFDPTNGLDNSKIKIAVPFSYYYHHLSNYIGNINLKQPFISSKFKGELLERQKLIRNEVFSILNRTQSILLCLHTGFGKTIFALYLASKIKMKTIILCHRKIIIDQWFSAITKYIPDVTVEILNPKKPPTADFVIGNVLTVPKCNEGDLDRTTFSEYGTLLLDEIHTVCTEQFSKALFHIFPQWIIGLSATPHRSDGMDKIIELYVGPEAVYKDMWRIFNVYKLNTQFTPEVNRNQDGSIEWNSALTSQATSETRNQLIVNIIEYFTNRKILVLVKRKDHAYLLKQMLNKIGYKSGDDVDTFMESDKSANYNCRVLIATYSKGGVGFDHPGLNMLIGAADVEENFLQYLGRVFRRDDTAPIYVDLIDNNPIMKKHSTTRIKICQSVGAIVRDFNKCFPTF